MEIVIKIPDKDYSVILTKIMLACHGCKIIELPKGHGRLIDADALIDTLGCSDKDIYVKACIEEDAPTIIEADKESEVD